MIKMGEKIEILRMHIIEGIPKKKIARDMNISKNTVKKYIDEFLNTKKELIEAGVSKCELIENMVNAPKYTITSRTPKVMTNEIKEIIIGYIKDNEIKKTTGRVKLCMSAQDMYEELIDKNYIISYPSVAQFVQKYKKTEFTHEAFIKQQYDFGDICEFDWGEANLVINNSNKKYRMAVFTMAKSCYRFCYLYENENTSSFVDAHIKFFENIGGVPKCLVYDNMKVAVAKFVGRTEKEATIALKKLSIYYNFKYRFCNIRSGNEKGHVENSVDFIRRKAFSKNYKFDSYDDALNQLSNSLIKHNNIKTNYLKKKSPMDLLTTEKTYLSKLMPTYINCIDITLRVDKLSTVSYLKNRYSVPDSLVLKSVDVKVFTDKLEIYYMNELVTSHTRLFGNQEWSINILHYVKTLNKKSGALLGSVAFNQMDNVLKTIYNLYFLNEPKQFIELLNIVSDHDISAIKKTIDILIKKQIEINIDNIKMILNRNDYVAPKITSNMQSEIVENSKKNLAMYDMIIGTTNIKEVVTI